MNPIAAPPLSAFSARGYFGLIDGASTEEPSLRVRRSQLNLTFASAVFVGCRSTTTTKGESLSEGGLKRDGNPELVRTAVFLVSVRLCGIMDKKTAVVNSGAFFFGSFLLGEQKK
jgi:hypothetical protein